jgi:hypothetical protein
MPASPVGSPEQLDWGSIEDKDGTYAPRVPLPELAELGQPHSSERGTAMVEVKGGQSSEALKLLLSPEKTLGSTSAHFEKQDRQKLVVVQSRHSAKGAALEMAAGGQSSEAFKPLLSSDRSLRAAPAWPKKQMPLKLVLVIPGHLNGDDICQERCDNSQEWQLVKPKRSHRIDDRPFPTGASMWSFVKPSSSRLLHLSLDYKAVFWSKCFHCLTSDHRVADCREPHRCLSWLCVGHLAHHCKGKPKPSIHSCLTFPPEFIQSRIAFPKFSYARAISTTPSDAMATAGCYVASAPDQQPSHNRVVVVADGAMMAELQKLHRRAVVLSSMHASVTHQPEEIAYELHRQLCVPHWNVTISRHKPENFPVRFDYPDKRDTAVRAHSLQVGTTVCLIQPWRLEGYTRPTNWYFRAKIYVKRLPLHA